MGYAAIPRLTSAISSAGESSYNDLRMAPIRPQFARSWYDKDRQFAEIDLIGTIAILTAIQIPDFHSLELSEEFLFNLSQHAV